MAENKQEKKTFKWGEEEYLLDDLLKLHADQERYYYNFAKDKGQYDDAALTGLRKAIASRIEAVKSGKTFDADGVLDTDTVDNIKIQTKKKGLLKKAQYVDQDNTEWAKYYLNQLVKNLKPHSKKESGGYNEAKHNFAAYLTGQGLKAKDVFEKYDRRDQDNPDDPRSFSERRNLLKQHWQGFKDWRASKKFDMTANDNEWDDNLDVYLDDIYNKFDSLDNNTLTAALRKIGAGDEYTIAFTSDRWDLSKSQEEYDAEQKALAEKRKKEKEEKGYASHVNSLYNTYKNSSGLNLGGSTYFTTKGDGLFTLNDSEYETWLNTHTNDKDAYMANLQKNYLANPFNTEYASEYLPLADRFGGLKEVNIDGKVYKYDPRTIDRQNNRFVIVDPESGEIRHAFIGDIQEEMANLKRKWRIENGYENETDRYIKSSEQGGVISMQTGGGFNLAQAVNRDLAEKNKAKAKKEGNTEEQQQSLDRVVSNGDDSFTSEEASIGQPNAGFNGADIARLVSIGADITSMFLDPVTGTAVGMGSTLTNFGADIADDGFQWSDVGNLGIGLGLDLVGAIPLFGDAIGTGTKITRNLVKWAPRVMMAMTAYQGVTNFDGMMESWGKFLSEDKDKKLTVQDWRNLAQSIGLITGATRAIKNKAAQNTMKQKAKVKDVVGVTVRDKDGNLQKILVDGDVATRIREAKGSKKDIEAELNKLEGYKDKFGEGKDFEVHTKSGGWQSPWGKIGTSADGSTERGFRSMSKEGKADVSDVYDFKRVKGYTDSWGLHLPFGISKALNKGHQKIINRLNNMPEQNLRGVKSSDAVDAEVKALRDPVDAQIKAMQSAMTRREQAKKRINQELTPEKQRLQDIQTRLRTSPDEATLTTTKQTLEQDIATNNANLTQRQQEVNKAKNALDKLLKKSTKRMSKDQLDAHNKAIRSARGKLRGHTTQLNRYTKTQQQFDADLAKLNAQLQDYADLNPVTANVDRLQRIQSGLGRGTHTHAYNKLQSMLNDLQTNHATVSGRAVNWDMAEILKQAGIKNAFKQGGSIDKNKINKFLNYAKG